MLGYVYGQDQPVARFVADMIPHCRRGFGENIKAIGVIDGDRLIAGFVFHNFEPEAGVIEISGAALPGSNWCTRRTLAVIYRYPFLQLECQMIVQRVLEENESLLWILSRYNYSFVKVPRLFGRNSNGVICCLTREAWASNRFNQKLRHHVQEPIEEAA
jgi:hypothetical protein